MTLKFRAVHTDIHWQRPDASQISCTMRRQYTSSFCEVSGAQLEAIAQIGKGPACKHICRKAFECCDHEIKVHKLPNYGFKRFPQKVFCNYLSNRQQCTKIGEANFKTLGCPLHQQTFMKNY